MPEGGSTCQNGLGQARFKKLQVAKFRVGQHAGIAQIKLQVSGWVNITGMVGQHSPESPVFFLLAEKIFVEL
jgi:hypothetical protein